MSRGEPTSPADMRKRERVCVDLYNHSHPGRRKKKITHHVLRDLIILRNLQLYNTRNLTVRHGNDAFTLGPRQRTRIQPGTTGTFFPLLLSRLALIVLPFRRVSLAIGRSILRHGFEKRTVDGNHPVPVRGAGVIAQRGCESNLAFLNNVVAVPRNHEFDVLAQTTLAAFEHAIGDWRTHPFQAVG